jgi:hypothetical protein
MGPLRILISADRVPYITGQADNVHLEHDILSIKRSMESAFEEYMYVTRDWDKKWATFKTAMESRDHSKIMAAGYEVNEMGQLAEAKKVSFILSCAALVEAIVNLLFTLKLSKHQFEAIDRCEALDKWVELVPFVISGFEIHRDGQIYQSLKELISDRNRITHMKPRAKEIEGGAVLHDGQLPKYSKGKLPDVIAKMKEWRELPRNLIEQVKKADDNLGSQLELFCWYMEFT